MTVPSSLKGRRSSISTVRLQVLLRFTRQERKAFETLCASELRTPGAMATSIISDHLTRRARGRSVNPVKAAPGTRRPWGIQLRVTREQRRELERWANRDGRTLSNYVTTVVVRALAMQRP